MFADLESDLRLILPARDGQHDGSSVEEGLSGGEGRLEVLCEAPVPADPGEEAFDHPCARMNREADLVGVFI